MTAINRVADLTVEGGIAVLTLNSPPVNAISAPVREGLIAGVDQAAADPVVKAMVLICEGRTFIAGADIKELDGERKGPTLADVLDTIENSPKPIVAAMHGTALGGGLEIALTCNYRVATPSARCGLPEVHLGFLPGAGGTQRLPRIVGAQRALEMIASGEHVGGKACLTMGLLDELVEEGGLRAGALAFARKVVGENRPLKRVRDLTDKIEKDRKHPEIFADFRRANARKFRGFLAPDAIVRAVEAAVNKPFDEGLKIERDLFLELVESPQSKAQRYTFFAERQVSKIPDVPDDTPLIAITKVAVIGAGTMGGGIAMNFANIGIPVTVIDAQQTNLDRGLKVIRSNYERTASRGGITQAQVEERMGLLTGSLDFDDVKDADLIIEAVFERMDLKKEIFRKLDAAAKPGAILATNTSFLNINEIAAETSRAENVIGMHFFAPANVMKLLEVVRAEKTSKEVVATIMKLGKQIGKVAVLVGVCHGFVANRIMTLRQRECQKLLLEGPMPWDIDRAIYGFGFPMGTFAMLDVVGLDVTWDKQAEHGETVRDALCQAGRYGQKTGAGFYEYDDKRNSKPSDFTVQAIKHLMDAKGLKPHPVSDQEILERTLYIVINEGAKVLDEGIAIRASDIDIITQNGYGWPAYTGGPMCWGDQIGLPKVLARLKEFEAALGPAFTPAPLLERLAAEGKSFADFKR